MNPAAIIARVQVFSALATLAIVAFLGVLAWRYFKGKNALDVAQDLKAHTPLGIPARTLDEGISAAAGREETLGGWFADLFNPAAREVNRQYGK